MAYSASPPSLPPLPLPGFWKRESRNIKQGIKTGLAGAITYAIYSTWHLPEGYWAVFTALVVTQANQGASWKAALYRTIGSTAGALAAAMLIPILGTGALRTGIALFLLASLFGYLTALHPSFSAAGFTVAIILIFSAGEEPWHLAWYRVLYSMLGAFVAFGVSVLIWPVRAREELRAKLAGILEGSGALYRAVTATAIEGVNKTRETQQLARSLHELRRGITQQMEDSRSELTVSRLDAGAYQAVVDLADQLRHRLTAMAEDSSLYVLAKVQPSLLSSLPVLAERTACAFPALAATLRIPREPVDLREMEAAVRELESDLSRLREQRTTSPFTLDRMLPFWAFVFNLREVAQELKQIEAALSKLS
jgi:uncharacterized membrane protein YgaE (UPF0421/DUF939 family)